MVMSPIICLVTEPEPTAKASPPLRNTNTGQSLLPVSDSIRLEYSTYGFQNRALASADAFMAS